MKKTKIFYGNQYIGKFSCGKETFVQRWSRKIKRAIVYSAVFSVASWTVFGAFQYGKLNAPVVVKAQEVVRNVPILNSPVLERIAKCESGNSQYDKTGQVLIKVNTNGTVDIGRFQINSVWKATATKLGYDLTKEEDNTAFAQWLYLNKGTNDWMASYKCWSK